jgi:hypothetical protein
MLEYHIVLPFPIGKLRLILLLDHYTQSFRTQKKKKKKKTCHAHFVKPKINQKSCHSFGYSRRNVNSISGRQNSLGCRFNMHVLVES